MVKIDASFFRHPFGYVRLAEQPRLTSDLQPNLPDPSNCTRQFTMSRHHIWTCFRCLSKFRAAI